MYWSGMKLIGPGPAAKRLNRSPVHCSGHPHNVLRELKMCYHYACTITEGTLIRIVMGVCVCIGLSVCRGVCLSAPFLWGLTSHGRQTCREGVIQGQMGSNTYILSYESETWWVESSSNADEGQFKVVRGQSPNVKWLIIVVLTWNVVGGVIFGC